jgi:hypothetical protein
MNCARKLGQPLERCQSGINMEVKGHCSHPSTASLIICGLVHLIASSALCVFNTLQVSPEQSLSIARCRESPFQPNT